MKRILFFLMAVGCTTHGMQFAKKMAITGHKIAQDMLHISALPITLPVQILRETEFADAEPFLLALISGAIGCAVYDATHECENSCEEFSLLPVCCLLKPTGQKLLQKLCAAVAIGGTNFLVRNLLPCKTTDRFCSRKNKNYNGTYELLGKGLDESNLLHALVYNGVSYTSVALMAAYLSNAQG